MKKNILRTNVFEIINGAILIILAAITLYPLWYVFMYSISNPRIVDLGGLYLLPKGGVFLDTYIKVLSAKRLLTSYGNTIFVVVIGTVTNMILTVITAFALSKKQVKGNKFFVIAFIFTMLFNGGIIPTFLVVKGVGLLNSLWALIIPRAILIPQLIILIIFFREIPDSIEESALIDGCPVPMILVRIILPLSIPAIATVALLYAFMLWNDFFQCMLYITDSKKHVLQLVLRNLILQGDTTGLAAGTMTDTTTIDIVTPQSIRMATIMVATIPILFTYPFVQKYFVKGLTLGAIKG